MKKIVAIMVLLFAVSSLIYAQEVPQGMKYQAVARNLKGEILANEQIVLKISLTSQQNNAVVTHYSELHNVKTNELGLFTLVIGEGESNKSDFKTIPWSSQNIWMEVAIADKAKGGFTVISSSKLLAVPYAFHAETAGKISGSKNITDASGEIMSLIGTSTSGTSSTSGSSGPTTSGNSWNTVGNYKTNSVTDYVGTADYTDFVLRTNAIERLRITKDGKLITPAGVGLELGGNLKIKGDSTIINNDFYVGRNVILNYLPGKPGFPTPGVIGSTINRGNFTVSDGSSTNLSGSLTVKKLVRFDTTTSSSSATTGALVVTGGTGIGENLNVGGITSLLNTTESSSKDDGSLVVKGGVGIEKNLNVGGNFDVKGTSSFKAIFGDSLSITKNTQGYLATFENTNNGNGDGIKIKLGKIHPTWDGSAYKHFTNLAPDFFDATFTKINEYIDGTDDWSVDDLVQLIPANILVGSVVKLTNYLIPKINDGLGLGTEGKVLLEKTDVLFDILTWINGSTCPGSGFGDFAVKDTWVCSMVENGFNPEADNIIIIPKVVLPPIPTIPEDGLADFPSFSVPNLSFNNVTNSLTNENNFLTFTDKDNRVLGHIRAQSLQNWRADYLDALYIMNLAATFVKTDLVSAVFDGITGFSNLVNDYNHIGVEYTSGNGDYAEWLERLNPSEVIGTGDIVAVKGGKITKDLKGAEQIMAVSHHPIVLGNVPNKEKTELGNNIAFMGQIPVKVMGPVKAGDYIVAKSEVPGYGVAVDPLNMKVEDYKLAVGRSWTTDSKNGMKMVNTVVGVHNNSFLDLIKELKEKTEESDSRLKAIEAKLNISSSDSKISTEKRAFK